MNTNGKLSSYFLLSLGIIILDQIVKLIIHFTMTENLDTIHILGDVFKLHYVTNPGMAFGIEFGGSYGKIFLSVFRLFAMFGIGWYMSKLYQNQAPKGFLICVAMILGGAVGNLVDSIFYGEFLGLLVRDAPITWFHGKVVDMFFVDIYRGSVPIPFTGNSFDLQLWPIFNVADSSIFVAVIFILIYQKRFFKAAEKKKHFTGSTKSI